MRMKRAIVCLLGGLTLVGLAGPATAQPVIYKVDLRYENVVDGPRPIKTIRVSMRAVSAQAAESMCGSRMNMLRMSKNVQEKNPRALGLVGSWMPGGGTCVTGKDGNIEMTVEVSSGGGN
jgi:hypothetical protein